MHERAWVGAAWSRGVRRVAVAALLLFGCLVACERREAGTTSSGGKVASERGVDKPAPAKAASNDPLPSWNEGPRKKALVDFITRVTTKNDPSFVPVDQRIATFDNDGTLWSEKPMYFEMAFALDRVRELAPEHPEWRQKQPFKAVLENDPKALVALGDKGAVELVMATHSGMTTDEFSRIVTDWLARAREPRFHRPYTDLVYQPMLELLGHLRAQGFKTFIVSGGGVEFMRAFAERVYGIPPEQVVGSSGALEYEVRGGAPLLLKLPKVDFIDDGKGKPIGIQRFIGRRPILAFGNSDGDFQMLEWTTAAEGARFGGIVHHTDAVREWAYDRKSPVGRLDKALDAAPAKHWQVVDMKNDWKVIYPFEVAQAPQKAAP